MNRKSRLPGLAGLLLVATLVSCMAMQEGMEGQKNAVARVEGRTLTIEHAAELLSVADESLVPARPDVIDPIADLWIGYTILATELASSDTFSNVDISIITRFAVEQESVWQLREDVILSKIEPEEDELRQIYEREQPYTEVQLQHILIRIPDNPEPAQVDSVRTIAEGLRERALAGESFEELARTYSQDPTSAAEGGSMGGWIGRTMLVDELDSFVFNMEPGTISETVRSTFGYHIVRITDRREPDYEEIREDYKANVMERYVGDQERIYIDSLFKAANARIASGAIELVREMAYEPRLERLSPAERATILVSYRGGALTLGEWAEFVIRRSPDSRRAFSDDPPVVEQLLHELVRNKLLVKAANERGYDVPDTTADSLRMVANRELFSVAAVSGLRREPLINGEVTIDEAVDQILVELLTRQRSPAPLERVAPALKSGRVYQVYPERFSSVIDLLVAYRSGIPIREAAEAMEAGS
jgi:hypothetical protein